MLVFLINDICSSLHDYNLLRPTDEITNSGNTSAGSIALQEFYVSVITIMRWK